MFKVSSGSWDIVVEATSYEEAVLSAAKLMYNKHGSELDVSYIFTVENVLTSCVEIFPTDAVFQDIGLYEIAYNLKRILDS